MKRIIIITICVLILLAGCGEKLPADTALPVTEVTAPADDAPEETLPPVETLPPEPLTLEPLPEVTAEEVLLLQGTADSRYPILIRDGRLQ